MKRGFVVLILAPMVIWAAVAGCSRGTEKEMRSPKALWQEKCTRCHSLSRSADRVMTPERWRETVERMQAKPFSNISEQEAGVILDHLIETRSK
jgi:hypothetical protein